LLAVDGRRALPTVAILVPFLPPPGAGILILPPDSVVELAAKATDGGDYWAYWSVTAAALSRMCTTAGFTTVENVEHYTLEAEDGAGYEYGVPHVVMTAIV